MTNKLFNQIGLLVVSVITSSLWLLLLSGCGSKKNLATVPSVNLEQYAGLWYEIASFPTSFQKGCTCTTARYSLANNGKVRVFNKCFRTDKNKWIDIEGFATVQPGSENSRLSVQFFWPFKGDYYIIDLAPDYSWAMVGHPGRNYLWILSRTPALEAQIIQNLRDKATSLDFDASRLVMTVQNCRELD